MKIKTGELTGVTLDWAVAKTEGMHVDIARGGWVVFDSDAFAEFRNDYNDDKVQSFRPSTNWEQGGPIIEREGISIYPDESEDLPDIKWSADSQDAFRWGGPTPLIAAMRCYVASHFGDEVDVPDQLLGV